MYYEARINSSVSRISGTFLLVASIRNCLLKPNLVRKCFVSYQCILRRLSITAAKTNPHAIAFILLKLPPYILCSRYCTGESVLS